MFVSSNDVNVDDYDDHDHDDGGASDGLNGCLAFRICRRFVRVCFDPKQSYWM